MARPFKTNKVSTHALMLQIPGRFWDELVAFYEQRKSFASYAELTRQLMRVGLDVLKKEELEANGREIN